MGAGVIVIVIVVAVLGLALTVGLCKAAQRGDEANARVMDE
jgi:hypothetical protein